MLYLLAIFLVDDAFKDYLIIEELLKADIPDDQPLMRLEWDERVAYST
jgi:hypothetical protein